MSDNNQYNEIDDKAESVNNSEVQNSALQSDTVETEDELLHTDELKSLSESNLSDQKETDDSSFRQAFKLMLKSILPDSDETEKPQEFETEQETIQTALTTGQPRHWSSDPNDFEDSEEYLEDIEESYEPEYQYQQSQYYPEYQSNQQYPTSYQQMPRKKLSRKDIVILCLCLVALWFIFVGIFSNLGNNTNKNSNSTSTYYESPSSYVEKPKKVYHITDTAIGDNIMVHVVYAYNLCSDERLYVNAVCVIQNIREDVLYFSSKNFFELNDGGIIATMVDSDYDYTNLASGAAFTTTVTFSLPRNSNMVLDYMTMMVDGIEFRLSDKVQDEDELSEFYGIYYRVDENTGELCDDSKYIIEHLSGDQYLIVNLVTVNNQLFNLDLYLDNYVYYVNLRTDNTFQMEKLLGTDTYRWNPEQHTISGYGDVYKKKIPS